MIYLAHDCGIGYGLAILAITVGIKTAFTPFQISMQKQQLKLKLIEPEMKIFTDMQSKAQKQQD